MDISQVVDETARSSSGSGSTTAPVGVPGSSAAAQHDRQQLDGQRHDRQRRSATDSELGVTAGDANGWQRDGPPVNGAANDGAANGHATGRGAAIEPVTAVDFAAATNADGSGSAGKAERHGMVLPFSPVTLTFRDVHYYVPTEVKTIVLAACTFLTSLSRSIKSNVNFADVGAADTSHCVAQEKDIRGLPQGGRELEVLKGITGVFRPGVLTALMGALLQPCSSVPYCRMLFI